MCDTFVALANSTADGRVLFAKNSDRDPNEAQELVIVEGKSHPAGSKVRCTYLEIPQVKRTYSVLLSKPFWIWGAEMGANENGVVIGNEAVFTKYKNNREPGLIGMDFLRLALERSASAREALEIITDLLAEYGQSGNCGFAHPFFYDNSYLIADRIEAWVLETAGRQWAAEKVKDLRSISNALTIEHTWDLASKDIIDEASKRGWTRNNTDFSFRKSYSDFLYTTFGAGKSRQACSTESLREKAGNLTTADMMRILRSHKSQKKPGWSPGAAVTGADICMHAGFGPIRVSQTAGSMIANLGGRKDLFWLTGTAAPCISLFKPVWLDAGLPEWDKYPEGKFDPTTLWWRGEELHRRVIKNYEKNAPVVLEDQERLEAEWCNAAMKLGKDSEKSRRDFTLAAFTEADRITQRWTETILKRQAKPSMPFYYRSFRKSVDNQAEFPD